jgi:hypothetical protein
LLEATLPANVVAAVEAATSCCCLLLVCRLCHGGKALLRHALLLAALWCPQLLGAMRCENKNHSKHRWSVERHWTTNGI